MIIGVQPEVVYAGVVGERNLKQATLPEPDMDQARWLQIENNSRHVLNQPKWMFLCIVEYYCWHSLNQASA